MSRRLIPHSVRLKQEAAAAKKKKLAADLDKRDAEGGFFSMPSSKTSGAGAGAAVEADNAAAWPEAAHIEESHAGASSDSVGGGSAATASYGYGQW